MSRPGRHRRSGRANRGGPQTERRGGAGPVRRLLGGKDLTGRFASTFAVHLRRFCEPSYCSDPSTTVTPTGPRSEIAGRYDVAPVPRAQGLQRQERRTLAQEAHGAVGEGEVGTARMAAAEGALPILQRGGI